MALPTASASLIKLLCKDGSCSETASEHRRAEGAGWIHCEIRLLRMVSRYSIIACTPHLLKPEMLSKFLALALLIHLCLPSILSAEDMFLARYTARTLPRQCPNPRVYNKLTTRLTSLSIQRFASVAKMDTQTTMDDLVSFWFDRDMKEWFYPPPGLDDEIRSRYEDLIIQARAGKLDDWAKEPKGVLCLVLLLDQFPRNIYRGSGESFSSDVKAQGIVTTAIAQQFDKKLGEVSKTQQQIMYMPLLHAEDLTAQVAAIALYENMALSCPEGSDERAQFEQSVDFTRRHMECVMQLGRFPKRNAALGRRNTPEEDQFLKDHPDGF